MHYAAITREEFANKTWWRYSNYAFASQFNVLPVTIGELSKLVPAMPLGFVRTETTFQLVAITSLQNGINLFVASDGNWIGDYIPAIVRTYPFKMIKPLDREDMALCFDIDSGLLSASEVGEPFFDADGPTTAIRDILNFLSELETSRIMTQKMVDVLQATGLLQAWTLNLQQGTQTVPVEGLYRIDETAFNSLTDEAFINLRKTGVLPLVYAQLFSMNQLSVLPRAAEVQARIRDQELAKTVTQSYNLSGMNFNISNGELMF